MIDGKGLNKLAIIAAIAGGMTSAAQAQTMTAGVIMEKMSVEDRFTFLAGIIEGLAHAKYAKGNRDTEGRACVYRWFYDDRTNRDKIYEAFKRYPNAMPGQVVGTLVATKCGA